MKNLLHKLGGTPPEDNKLYQVGIHYKRPLLEQLVLLSSSEDAYRTLLKVIGDVSLDFKEYFWIFLVNRAGYIVGFQEVGRGTIKATIINVPEIFQLALLANATGIILLHNHPSGRKEPSPEDRVLTHKIKTISNALDIKLWDHLILTSEGYYSFLDEGEL